MRLCRLHILLRTTLLAAFFVAYGSPVKGEGEFTVRLAERLGAGGASSMVSLYEPCASYDCGVELLTGMPKLRPEFRRPFEAGRLFRGVAPEGDIWWVVVESQGHMPMALLWRPPVAVGDLPPAPVVSAAMCSIDVRDGDGRAIEGAIALPRGVGVPTESRPSLFNDWRPWSPPSVANEQGRIVLRVPSEASLPFLVGARDHGFKRGICSRDSHSTVVLPKRQTRMLEVFTTEGEPLAAALARSADGWPLAVTDEDGRLELPTAEKGLVESSGPSLSGLWFETTAGAVYDVTGQRADRVSVASVSNTYQGTIYLVPIPPEFVASRASVSGTSDVQYWRQRSPPWPAVDQRAASPLRQATNGQYREVLLPEEALWFSAPGRAYEYCRAKSLDNNGPRRETKDGAPCPQMLPARSVNGRVVDDAGAPIPDAEILLDWTQGTTAGTPTVIEGMAMGSPTASLLLLRSGANGSFHSDRVGVRVTAARPFRDFAGIRVRGEGYLPVTWGNIQRFEKGPGRYEVPLQRGVPVTGRILDPRTDTPIEGAEIALGRFASSGYTLALGPLDREYSPYGNAVRFTRTVADGSFRLMSWLGQWDLLVRAAGRVQHQVKGFELGPQGLDLGIIRLERGFEIEGIVHDGSRNPIPSARVEVAGIRTEGAFGRDRSGPDRRFNEAAIVVSAQDGRFVATGLAEDSYVNLRVRASGFAEKIVEKRSPTTTRLLEIALEPEAVIAGRVTLDGGPVSGRVRLFEPRRPFPIRSLDVDEDGEFEFAGVGANRYSLEVKVGRPDIEPWRSAVEARAGHVTEVAVTLEAKPGDRTLFGTVAEKGIGVPNVEVRASGLRTVTDGSGRYEIHGLRPGFHSVAADRGNESSPSIESVRIRDRTARLDFDFSEARTQGTAYWSDNSPVALTKLRFFGGRPVVIVETDAGGTFDVYLEHGQYIVSTVPDDGDPVASRQRLNVTGPESDLRIVFGRQRIAGSVVGLTKQELGRLRVEAVNLDDLDTRPAKVDSSGHYVIERIDSGRWNVVGTVGAAERRASREVLVGRDHVEVNLEFKRLLGLSGVVRLDGIPLNSTRVILAKDLVWAEMRQTWTVDDGSFHFSDLERGHYRIGVGASIRDARLSSDEHMVIDLGSG